MIDINNIDASDDIKIRSSYDKNDVKEYSEIISFLGFCNMFDNANNQPIYLDFQDPIKGLQNKKIYKIFQKVCKKEKLWKDMKREGMIKKDIEYLEGSEIIGPFGEIDDNPKQYRIKGVNINIQPNFLHDVIEKYNNKIQTLIDQCDEIFAQRISFDQMSPKQRSLIALYDACVGGIAVFTSWFCFAQFFDAVVGSGKYFYSDECSANLVGQALFGVSIEAIGGPISASIGNIFQEFKNLMPSYVVNSDLKHTFANVNKFNDLVQTCNDLNLNEGSFSRKLKSKIGDSSHFLTLSFGLDKNIKSIFRRIKNNLINQLIAKRNYSYQDGYNQFINNGDSKVKAGLKAGSKKVWHVIMGFFGSIFGVEYLEDFGAGLASFVPSGKYTADPTLAACAAMATFCAQGVKSYHGNSLNRPYNIALKKGEKFNFKNLLSGIQDNFKSNIFSTEYYKIMTSRIIGRVSGRLLFEACVKPAVYSPNSPNNLEKLQNAAYEGLRAGFAQHAGLNFSKGAYKVFQYYKQNKGKIEVSNAKDCSQELRNYYNSTKKDLLNIMNFLKNDIEQDKNNKILKNDKKHKIHLKYKYNWYIGLLNTKMSFDKVEKVLNKSLNTQDDMAKNIAILSMIEEEIKPNIQFLLVYINSFYKQEVGESFALKCGESYNKLMENKTTALSYIDSGLGSENEISESEIDEDLDEKDFISRTTPMNSKVPINKHYKQNANVRF